MSLESARRDATSYRTSDSQAGLTPGEAEDPFVAVVEAWSGTEVYTSRQASLSFTPKNIDARCWILSHFFNCRMAVTFLLIVQLLGLRDLTMGDSSRYFDSQGAESKKTSLHPAIENTMRRIRRGEA